MVAIGLIFAFVAKEAMPIFLDPGLRAEVRPWGMVDHTAWAPVSDPPRYSLWPLLSGTLKVTAIALLVATPLALGAALFSAQVASASIRAWMKPTVELLAGIPSVVVGFIALVGISEAVQVLTGAETRLNALTAGLALGIALVPIIYAIAEDALFTVPKDWLEASYALGALNGETLRRIAFPAASSGVMAAVTIGGARALGETMIVLMAAGNAPQLTLSPLDSVRTLTATIASEMGEVAQGSGHYHVLFALAAILFVFTFTANILADALMRRARLRLVGRH